jgi:actin related protein 2/3 complex, subunit 3
LIFFLYENVLSKPLFLLLIKASDTIDVIDEAIGYFKANIFFKNYEIKSEADRTLIYATLYISECLRVLQKSANKIQAQKDMDVLANSKFDIPGDAGFPLNALFTKPANKREQEEMRQFIKQLRLETGVRILTKVYENSGNDGKASKWWLCFAKRRFMDQTLTPLGQFI